MVCSVYIKVFQRIINTSNTTILCRGKVYQSLMELYPKYACKQFLENLPLLSLYCDYSEDDVPQVVL